MDRPKLGSILVVDDDISLMRMLCEVLRDQGYDTEGFTQGRIAVQRMKEHDFDILLTDLVMPEMNGIDVLRAGLEVDPNLVGIVMTGHGSVQTAVEAMRIGAFDYTLKPFKPDTLLASVSRAMGARSLKKDNIELRGTIAMYELTKAVTLSTDLALVVNKVADAVIEQTGADEVSVMLPTGDDDEELYVAAVRGSGREHILGQRIKFGEGIAGWVARHHQLLRLEGEVSGQPFKPMWPRPEIKASISLPIMAGGRFVGVLNLNAINRRSFTAGQIKALSVTVSLVGPSIQNAGLFQMLQEAEHNYRSIFENAVEGIFQTTPEGILLRANPALARLLGFESPEQAMHDIKDLRQQVYVNPVERDGFKQKIEAQGFVTDFESALRRKDGSIVTVKMNARAVRSDDGAVLYYEGSSEDVTDKKLVEEALRQSEEHYRSLFHNMLNGYAYCRMIFEGDIPVDFTYLEVNDAFETLTGLKNVTGKYASEVIPRIRESDPGLLEIYGRVSRTAMPERFEVFVEAMKMWFSISVYSPKKEHFVAIFDVITERKQAEHALSQSEKKYRSIFENAAEGIFQSILEGRFINVNPAMVRIYGYESREDMMSSITNIADQLWLSPEDSVRYKEILNECGVVEGFEAPSRKKDGTPIWVKLNTRAVKASDGAVLHYDGIVEDITARKQGEEELRQTVEKLRNALARTIQAMSMMVEARDPYTAGHQRRVSILAGAIAGELSLSRGMVDTIVMAATIHDIGKISIPADILSKPTRLSLTEMGLIKTHSQVGHDVLKDVDLPCPIAQIVLQHHERLDGSGYPQGLKDGEILLGARVVSVADVVEAMVSHRPYRPGLGIDAAIEEIEQKKGLFYDPGVVDACLRLFQEKGFKFE